MFRFTLKRKRDEFNQFIVKGWLVKPDGEFTRYDKADYFTDNWQDAVDTFMALTLRARDNGTLAPPNKNIDKHNSKFSMPGFTFA